jgi:hypothetical protein
VTALSIAKNIARGVGIVPPSALVNNNNQDALRLLQAINDAGKYLIQKDWNCMVVEATISSSLTTTYALPSDYKAIVPLTMWHIGDREPVGGPLPTVNWQAQRKAVVSLQLWDQVRIEYQSGSQVLVFLSALGSAEKVGYYYRSKGWVNSSNSRVASVSADTDTFFIPEYAVETEAKWRFLKSIGQPFSMEMEEAKEVCESEMANDGGMMVLRVGPPGPFSPHAVTPETDVGL